MLKSWGRISGDEYKNIIKILEPCMDDHLYIMDIRNDSYSISESAVERFNIPGAEFNNAAEELLKFTYIEDRLNIHEEIMQIARKEKEFHNLQYRWLDRQGHPIWINCRGRVLFGEDGEPEYLVGCINEIGKKQKADNVSGLLGESGFQQEMSDYKQESGAGYILRLGIDNFKEINENKGMNYGDMILKKTAECIVTAAVSTGKNLTVYRVVGDEFILSDFSGTEKEAKMLYREIRRKIDAFIAAIGYEVFFTVSGGILNLSDVVNHSFEDVMKLSEFSLSQAKVGGKNIFYIFKPEDYQKFVEERKLIQILRQSVNNGFVGFEAYFQPVVDMKDESIYGAEALLRFQSPETGPLLPYKFIPLLEESGLIIPVGKWMLDRAMEVCGIIQQTKPDFKISVNLSYIQVLKSNVVNIIKEGMEKNNLKRGSIVVELTESGFLETNANFIDFCNGLQANGIPLALDDFGTGYSNFHYLYQLSPDTIKIDRSFTVKALNNTYEYSLLRHMVEMSHSIDMKLCIEGIETRSELDKISEMGPDYIQGYYFGKPCNYDDFMKQFVNK